MLQISFSQKPQAQNSPPFLGYWGGGSCSRERGFRPIKTHVRCGAKPNIQQRDWQARKFAAQI